MPLLLPINNYSTIAQHTRSISFGAQFILWKEIAYQVHGEVCVDLFTFIWRAKIAYGAAQNNCMEQKRCCSQQQRNKRKKKQKHSPCQGDTPERLVLPVGCGRRIDQSIDPASCRIVFPPACGAIARIMVKLKKAAFAHTFSINSTTKKLETRKK